MKKIIALFLSMLFVLSLAACGGGSDPSGNGGATNPANPGSSDTPETQTDRNGNVIPGNLPDAALTNIHETFNDLNIRCI